jgi:oligopeptide/dipeptide ABC transporter ATP-binding protein
MTSPLLQANNVTKMFGGGPGRSTHTAVENFSMTISGDTPSITALVGESGSGKTTLARMFLGLTEPTSGEVLYRGKRLQRLDARERKLFRSDVQIILQDPFDVYNPFYRVDHLLTVVISKFHLASSRAKRRQLMESALTAVGLVPDEILGRYPHQLSGGQRQRVAIARALLIRPRLIIADEPVSMVDASLRATILFNLQQLNREFGISILYITHDLATAFQLSENMIVLYRGSVAEVGDVEQIVRSPRHPYTQQLIGSIPQPDPSVPWSGGAVLPNAPRPAGAGTGCKFAPRCPHAMDVCWVTVPPLFRERENLAVSCFLYKDAPVLSVDDMDSVFSPIGAAAGTDDLGIADSG